MKIKKTTLKNGLRIVTVPMKNNPTVTVLVIVEAGTRYETRENNGLSHFLEHMCFKGTKKRGNKQIAYELEAMGAETNAFTSYDYTGYYAKARADLFPRLLDVVSDVYLNSTFPDPEIEKERGVICGELDMYQDIPQRRIHDLFAQSMYGDQPAGYSVIGTKNNINRFIQKDFINYHTKHYIASKTIVVVVGDCDVKTVETMIKKSFKDIKLGKSISKKKVLPITGDKISVIKKITDQSHIVLGLKAPIMGHVDSKAFAVMTALLGQGMSSRLFITLREELGAGYYVNASYNASNDTADITISTGTEPKRISEVIKAIKLEIDRLTNELVPEPELQKTKNYLIGNMYMGLESSDSVAFHVAHYAILHELLKTPADLEKEIKSIKSKDILHVAKKYFKPDQFHIAIIGPHTESEIKKVI